MIETTFQESKGTYGVDRICGQLRKRGKIASYHRVKRFTDDIGLHSIHNVDLKDPLQIAVEHPAMNMSIWLRAWK